MRLQVFGERGHRIGVFAVGHEQHTGTVEIDKQRDVGVAPARRCRMYVDTSKYNSSSGFSARFMKLSSSKG